MRRKEWGSPERRVLPLLVLTSRYRYSRIKKHNTISALI